MASPVGHRPPEEQPAECGRADETREVDDQAAGTAESDPQDVVRHHARHEDEKPHHGDRHCQLECRAGQTAAEFPRRADTPLDHVRKFVECLCLVAGAVAHGHHATNER